MYGYKQMIVVAKTKNKTIIKTQINEPQNVSMSSQYFSIITNRNEGNSYKRTSMQKLKLLEK